MNNTTQLEITSDFERFKIGLVNRIINNYEDTVERQQAIDKIPDITIEQAEIINNSIKKPYLRAKDLKTILEELKIVLGNLYGVALKEKSTRAGKGKARGRRYTY
jgi:ribosomal protein L4